MNKKCRIMLLSILVSFALSLFMTGCTDLNLKNKGVPEVLNQLQQYVVKAADFPTPPEGVKYVGYIIKWTSKDGNQMELKVKEPKDTILPNGVKEGTKVIIIPLKENPNDPNKPIEDKPKPIDPKIEEQNWKSFVKLGIECLKNQKWDEALKAFENAYNAEKNNETKTYYALVKLASISTKAETVAFMQNTIGLEKYPSSLNALFNLEVWFKEYESIYKRIINIRLRTADFNQENYGNYYKVNGHVAKKGEDLTGKTTVYLYELYTENTISDTQGKWICYSDKAEYDYYKAKNIKHIVPIFSALKFVIDEFTENGKYIAYLSNNNEQSQKKYRMADSYYKDIEIQYHPSYYFPQIKQAASWYKDFYAFFQIFAYILETNKGNFDSIIDSLYSIVFGAEFNEAKKALESIDSSKPITINEEFFSLIAMPNDQAEILKNHNLKKDELLGIVGSLTVAKGAFEWLQSYSFNFKDINIFKWNWNDIEDILKNLKGYNKDQDPFNNGFLTGRSKDKMNSAKVSFEEGLTLLIKMYESVTQDENLPSEAKEAIKQYEFIKEIVEEVKNAIKEGKKANFLIGDNNAMKQGFNEFKIDMGKVFTYEYFKLSNLFEMKGNKPKIYKSENGKPAYMNFTFKDFMNDFVEIKNRDNEDVFANMHLHLPDPIAEKIIKFYE